MIIAQITDVHLGFDKSNPDEINRLRLDRTLLELARATVLPRSAAGDRGSDRSWATGTVTRPFAMPSPASLSRFWPCLGNHDQRENFCAVFPEVPVADGFIQYALDLGDLRLLVP